MKKLALLCFAPALFLLGGCDNKPAAAPAVPAPADKGTGIQVTAPNVDVKSDANGVQVKAPGTDINIGKK